MKKVILAITLAATAAAIVPAHAEPRASSTLQVGNQCFKPTDSARGYGYWTSCDKVYSFVVARVGRIPNIQINREVLAEIERGGGTEGGGGGEGSGGGGGGGR